MGSGGGTDPRRSRAFNPVRQARPYDASGEYVRRYVGELSGAGNDLIFAPSRDRRLLQETGYPEPLISVPSA